MASKLSLLRRQHSNTRKSNRSRRLWLEQLEDRLTPAATLLVSTALGGGEQVLREFTQSGSEIRTVLLPPIQGGQVPGRDLISDPGGLVHVYQGTSDPILSSYTLAGGGWGSGHSTFGWSTYDQYGFGGIGRLGNYVFVTDMSTNTGPGDELKGVVRFDLTGGPAPRFLESEEPIDLTIGKDGKLYLLMPGNILKKYDPNSLALLGTVTLPQQDFRGIAVNAQGQIFAVAWN